MSTSSKSLVPICFAGSTAAAAVEKRPLSLFCRDRPLRRPREGRGGGFISARVDIPPFPPEQVDWIGWREERGEGTEEVMGCKLEGGRGGGEVDGRWANA